MSRSIGNTDSFIEKYDLYRLANICLGMVLRPVNGYQTQQEQLR